jgi:cytochrome o ubiquinol oxidase operon protein cyoD
MSDIRETQAGHGHGDDHHRHAADDGHHGHDNTPHSTLRGYLTGFALAVVLTAIPFWIVMAKVFDKPSTTAFVVLGIAAVQIVVHMVYFLHMNGKVEGGWSMLALMFTMVLVVITLSGSLWVMYHLNHNMMPADIHDMRNMP